MYKPLLTFVFFLVIISFIQDANTAGKWKGIYETATGSSVMELTLSHQGKQWNGVARFPEVEEQNTFLARDLKVSDTQVSFLLEVENNGGQARFVGKPSGDRIEGTFERIVDGEKAYTGRWSVEREKTPAAVPGKNE